MPVNAIAMPFSFAAAIDSSSLIDPQRLETGVRLAICDSVSLTTVVSLNDLGASALESQNRKPDPGFGFQNSAVANPREQWRRGDFAIGLTKRSRKCIRAAGFGTDCDVSRSNWISEAVA